MRGTDRLVERLFSPVWAVPLLLGVALTAQFLLTGQPGPESDAVNLVGGWLLAAALIWRRSRPLAMILAFTAVVLINESLDGSLFSFPEDWQDHPSPPPFASVVSAIVAFYSVGADPDGRRAWIGLAIGLAGFWTTVFISEQADVGSFFFSGLITITPWVVGRNALAREQRLRATEREEEGRTRLAVADERARIARELHDVVAHSVGIIVVQADGARRLFDREPQRARDALDSIETTARQALVDMRRSLGVLRDEAGDAVVEPPPSVERIDGLLDQARAAGLRVELEVEGEPREVPQGIGLSGYRIIQEALTNVMKHAAASEARVTVRYLERGLEVEIADDGTGPTAAGAEPAAGSHGLVGMRERVTSHGGELSTGAGPNGGFLVRATLPYAP